MFQLNSLAKSPEYMCRHVSLRSVPAKPDASTNHDEKNMALGRPMSPHIMIYHFELPANLSISHRITGMMLTGYMAALGVGALVLPHDISYYVDMIESWQLSAPTLIAAKFTIAYPFTYHMINGVRHLFWDTGKFLKMKEVYSTGYAMLGTSVALAAIMAIM